MLAFRNAADHHTRANEHPTNMSQNVAYMEQSAQGRDPRYSPHMNGSPQPPSHTWSQQPVAYNTPPPLPPSQPLPSPTIQSYQQQQYSTGLAEQPNFSPFPVIRDPPRNIPPTDEQREATLESARGAVLACNDPDVQLTWAQDTLSYVEVAQQNDARLASAQGSRARTPRIEHMLKIDAIKIVTFLADQHHPRAEFMRGMWLEFGKFGERIDKKEAFYCYQRASEKGYSRADYRIGMQFESSNDALKAIKHYQKGVDAGDSAANYRLGMMTLLGQHGQPQDFERGLHMIFFSAETADENAPQGAYVFGMLQAGELPQIKVPESYLPRDIAAAKINVEKAAYLGFSKAQVKMGSAYELGELGCPFDPAMSLHYNNLAARQGESEAEMAISKWFLCGQEGVFEKNEDVAFEYAQRAALNGLATAQFAMGYFFEVGICVKPDFPKAKDWYRQAADNGNPDAGGRIDAISRSKTLSRKDHESTALKRIRDQYGNASHNAPHMPPVPEVTSPSLNMPDPSQLSLNSTPARPPTNAPYPPGSQFNIPGSTSVPDFRPTSAFGINPNLRPNSASPMVSPRPEQYGGMPPTQQRTSYGGYETRPDYGRRPSGPPASQSYGPQGGPHGRPPPPQKTNTASPYLHPQGGRPTPPPQSRVDIGFSAPQDPTGADRKQRPQDPYQNRPYPPAKGGNPPRGSSRPMGPPQSGPRPGGPPNGQARPPQQQVRPPQPQPNIQPANIASSKPPANAPAASQRPTGKPNAVQPSKAKKPGKGPATFEEMGIPNKKDKGDCVSVLHPLDRSQHANISQIVM